MLIVLLKISFPIHLKHSSFWSSADAKPMSNDRVQALPWHPILSLYVYTCVSLWVGGEHLAPSTILNIFCFCFETFNSHFQI
jgi:hypothetical protein